MLRKALLFLFLTLVGLGVGFGLMIWLRIARTIPQLILGSVLISASFAATILWRSPE